MTGREILTKWGFEVDTDKLNKVESQLDAIKHRLEFLGAVEVIKGVVELTERFSKFAEELHVAATSAGVTVEAFQKLSFAAKQSAVDQGEMSGAMARLSRHLYEARRGGVEAQQAFSQAGFTAQQIKGFHTGSDVMLALADRFKGIQDPIQKQALAMQLMGRGSVNMVGFLSQGSAAIKGMGTEAEKLGVVLSEKQVDALVKVEHAFMKVYAVIKSIGAQIAAQLAPNITYVINTFLKWYAVNQKLISTNLKKWVFDFTYALGYIWGAVEGVAKVIYNFANQHKSLFKFIEVFLAIAASLAVLNFAAKKVLTTFDTIKQWFTAAKFLFTNPFSLALIAITLLIVAIHDVWNAVHGKPTWVQGFIEWLGIADQVQAVFFAIFDIMKDIMNLNFGKLITDVVGDVKNLGSFFTNLVGGGGAVANVVNKVTNIASAAIPSIAPSLASSSSNVTVNAPMTINAAGADHKVVAQKVKEGVRDHLDRAYREANRSLRGAQAY